MKKKKFWSHLFQRYIKPEEDNYKKYVEAELLYRIDKLEYEGIDSSERLKDWKKYKDYHKRLKDRWNGDFVA